MGADNTLCMTITATREGGSARPKDRRTGGPRLVQGERGFTLPELSVVIAVMGILFAIALPSWFGVLESREVDSATNQLASDLRLAHSTATNRLTDQVVTLSDGGSTYNTGTRTPDLDDDPTGDEVKVDTASTTVTITFGADGSATVSPSGTESFEVESADGSVAHTINLNTATSRVQIDPPTP